MARSLKLIDQAWICTLLTALVLCAACGKAKHAVPQVNGQLVLPPLEDGSSKPFALVSDGVEVGFVGTLLLWNDKVKPAQIARIARDSQQTRQLRVETLNYDANVIAPAAAVYKAAANDHAAANGAVDAEANHASTHETAIDHAHKRDVSGAWFAKRLAELAASGQISPEQKAFANTMFGAYCESKLWELASSDLARLLYPERPTPNQMCEPYYTSRNYFSSADRCGLAADPSVGKSYFQCLWQDGILNSALLPDTIKQTPCDKPAMNRYDAIKSWIESGLLLTVFSDTSLPANAAFGPSIFNGLQAPLKLKQKYPVIAACRTAFQRKSDINTKNPTSDFKAEVPRNLKNIGERDTSVQSAYSLLPSLADPVKDEAAYNILGKYINWFSARDFAGGPGGIQVSYSDVQFNHPVNVTPMSAGPSDDANIKQDPEFKDLFTHITPPDLAAAAAKAAAAEDAASATELASITNEPIDARQKNQSESRDAVRDAGATLMVREFALTLVRDKSQLWIKSFSFDDNFDQTGAATPHPINRRFTGCIDMDTGARCDTTIDNFTRFSQMRYDKGLGSLQVTIALDSPVAVGINGDDARSRDNGAFFSVIPDAELTGKILKLSLNAGKLSDILDFFTGDASVVDGTQTVFNGSLTGDNFDYVHKLYVPTSIALGGAKPAK